MLIRRAVMIGSFYAAILAVLLGYRVVARLHEHQRVMVPHPS